MYRYYFDDDKRTIYAVTTYAKKPVRAKAVCAPEDTYSTFKGADLARARCDVKVSEKRIKNAEAKVQQAYTEWMDAKKRYAEMKSYLKDAKAQLKADNKRLKLILDKM